jgi:phosphoribosylaminoimidazole (AIR) synthetase
MGVVNVRYGGGIVSLEKSGVHDMGWSVVRLGASLVHTLFGLTRRERTERERRGGNRKAP